MWSVIVNSNNGGARTPTAAPVGSSSTAAAQGMPPQATASDSRAQLKASPNTVTVTGQTGTTKITWNTGNGMTGQIYVAPNKDPEMLFAEGSEGAVDAPWIAAGVTYSFRLYLGREHKVLLAEEIVTGKS